MILDIIGVTLVLIFFIRGYMKGLVVAIFSLLAIVLGIICALKLSHILATWLYDKGYITSGWGQLISYVIIFVVVIILVRLVAKAIEASMNAIMLGWVNKGLGGVVFAFIAAFVWSTLLWIATRMHLISQHSIDASRTYKYFSELAPWICDQVGKLLPFAKHIFDDLRNFFDHVDQKIPTHVGAH
jgi:membrane protein required for colicin V production